MAFAGIIKEIHLVVNDFEIFWERQRGTRLFRQIRMFEKRGIVSPRRQYDGNAFRGNEIHGLTQQTGGNRGYISFFRFSCDCVMWFCDAIFGAIV